MAEIVGVGTRAAVAVARQIYWCITCTRSSPEVDSKPGTFISAQSLLALCESKWLGCSLG